MAWGNRFNPLQDFAKRQQQRAEKEAKKQAKPIKVKTEEDKWNIHVRGGEWTPNGSFRFLICGAHYSDLDGLDRQFSDTKIFHCNFRDNESSVGRWLVVNRGRLEDFENIIPNIVQFFKSYKITNYKEESIDALQDSFKESIMNAPTLQEVRQQKSKIAKNWKEIVTQLTSDSSKKKLLKTQMTFVNDPVYSAAALSKKNVIEVLMVDPDATFYTSEWTWNNVFKRRVLPGSPFAIISKASVPNQGIGIGYNFARTKYNNTMNNAAQSFFKVKAYDIRFTEPIDPNDDPFLSLENQLSNNINPKLNDAYKNELSQSGVNVNDISTEDPQYGLINDRSKKAFLVHIEKLNGNSNLKIGGGSFEDMISRGIYDFAINQATEHLNKLKSLNQQAFASAVLVAVSHTYNFESDMTKKALDSVKRLSSEELSNMSREMFMTYLKIVNFSYIKESVGNDDEIMSYEEFTSFITSLGRDNEKVLEQFNNFLKRMNDVK